VAQGVVKPSQRFDDLFAEFGPVVVKRFFGGEGIYAGDVMIGMVFDDIIYFATDEETRKSFAAEKCRPFTFEKRSTGETVVTHWYAAPDRLYDDPEELARWARTAHTVAAMSPTAQRKRAKAQRDEKGRRG
jgi:DNA transformation protein and related proteins